MGPFKFGEIFLRGISKLLLVLIISGLFNISANAKLSVESSAKPHERVRDELFRAFHDDIHPKLISAYNFYLNTYGNAIGATALKAFDHVAPRAKASFSQFFNYIHNINPEFVEEIRRVPAPFKMLFEKLMFSLYFLEYSVTERVTGKPLQIGAPGEIGVIAVKVLTGQLRSPHDQNLRLNKLLEDIRPHVLDKEMATCYKVHAVPLKIYELAVSTGCNIFIFEGLYANFEDHELRAIIAHEIAHSDEGDSIKRFAFVTKTLGYHFSRLTLEELHWILTGEILEYLDRTGQDGNTSVALETFNKDMQKTELRADMISVRILNAAGFSGNDAISALFKDHSIKNGELPNKREPDYRHSHPNAYERYHAIKSAMKF